MSKLQELIAERARLESEITALMAAGRRDAIEQVRALIKEHSLTPEEVGLSATGGKGRAAAAAGKVAPKYRDPETGAVWSGRGVAPKWISGKDRAQFLIAG
ncbi:MAG: H-NS family nucleoid-associated regulatory protein [Gammaproteobacteria bacterium]